MPSQCLSCCSSVYVQVENELGGIDLKLQFTLYLLGLRNAANTIVGSKTKRGVSGGEAPRDHRRDALW